jgi:hypothetical protein
MGTSIIKHVDVGGELSKEEWESEESHELLHGNSFPSSPVERQGFYRDDLHKWYVYNGSAWVWLGSESDQPLSVSELTLTPKESSTSSEGTIYYDSVDKCIYVAVE